MRNHRRLLALCPLLLLVVSSVAVLANSVPTVYVSVLGEDGQYSSCTRSSPCKTIARALSIVSTGGVVDIVSSGAYDAFTVSHAVTVKADQGVTATINVPPPTATNSSIGITIQPQANDVVDLQHLAVQGAGGMGVGIEVSGGARVTVEDCVSRGGAYGITYGSGTPSTLKVVGGIYEGSNTGIYLTSGNNKVNVDNVTVYGGGAWAGINADGQDITIANSLISGDGGPYGVFVINNARVVLKGNTISNFDTAVIGNGRVYFSENVITNNNYGAYGNFGSFYSSGDNTIIGNNIADALSLGYFSAQ